MKSNTYYLQLFVGISLGAFLFTLLFGDFYPTMKSLFFTEADTSKYFQDAMAKTNWTRAISKPLFIGVFVTFFSYLSDRKKTKK